MQLSVYDAVSGQLRRRFDPVRAKHASRLQISPDERTVAIKYPERLLFHDFSAMGPDGTFSRDGVHYLSKVSSLWSLWNVNQPRLECLVSSP